MKVRYSRPMDMELESRITAKLANIVIKSTPIATSCKVRLEWEIDGVAYSLAELHQTESGKVGIYITLRDVFPGSGNILAMTYDRSGLARERTGEQFVGLTTRLLIALDELFDHLNSGSDVVLDDDEVVSAGVPESDESSLVTVGVDASDIRNNNVIATYTDFLYSTPAMELIPVPNSNGMWMKDKTGHYWSPVHVYTRSMLWTKVDYNYCRRAADESGKSYIQHLHHENVNCDSRCTAFFPIPRT